jgi:hypothetical protein
MSLEPNSHNQPEHEELVLGVAVLVDDLHLFDDRRLARLSRAYRETAK